MTKHFVTDGSLRVRHVGILEMGTFYTWMQRWFDFYFSWKDSNEKYYREIILPDGNSKNVEMRWEVKKDMTYYFDHIITLDFLFIAVKDTEIQKEGERKKVQKGDFEIRIGAYVETKNLPPILKGFMERVFLRKRIETHQELLFDKLSSFHSEVKKIFNQYAI